MLDLLAVVFWILFIGFFWKAWKAGNKGRRRRGYRDPHAAHDEASRQMWNTAYGVPQDMPWGSPPNSQYGIHND